MENTKPRRKLNSIFDEQVKAINSFGIGSIYRVKDLRNRMKVGYNNTERVGDYHLDILSTKCIERVSHGVYRVLGFIPDFLTLNMCEANRGYTTIVPNPKYVGKSEHYGNSAYSYKTWHINNERPECAVLRGKKWKLGDPDPHVSVIETKKIQFILDYSTLYNSAGRKNQFKVICATTDKGMKFIISRVDGLFAFGDCNQVPVKVQIDEISILVLVPSKKSIKHDQIIEILKRGLSASDAADLIIKL